MDSTRAAYISPAGESRFDAITVEASCGSAWGSSHPMTAPLYRRPPKQKSFPEVTLAPREEAEACSAWSKPAEGAMKLQMHYATSGFSDTPMSLSWHLIPGAFRRLVPTWYACLLSGPHCAAGQVWRRQGRQQSGAPQVMAVCQRPYGRNPIRPCAKSAIKRGADCCRYMERWCTAHSGFETRRRGSESPAIQTHMPVSSLVERSASRPLQVRYLP